MKRSTRSAIHLHVSNCPTPYGNLDRHTVAPRCLDNGVPQGRGESEENHHDMSTMRRLDDAVRSSRSRRNVLDSSRLALHHMRRSSRCNDPGKSSAAPGAKNRSAASSRRSQNNLTPAAKRLPGGLNGRPAVAHHLPPPSSLKSKRSDCVLSCSANVHCRATSTPLIAVSIGTRADCGPLAHHNCTFTDS